MLVVVLEYNSLYGHTGAISMQSVAMHRLLPLGLTGLIIISLSSLLIPLSFIVPCHAHFEHLTHYNNRGSQLGEHYAYEALEPNTLVLTNPLLSCSASRTERVGIHTILILWSRSIPATGQRIEAWPWTRQR